MTTLDHAGLLEALKAVDDPELHKDIVSLGMVEEARVEGRHVHVRLRLTTPACPLKGSFEKAIAARVAEVFGADVGATVTFSDKRLTPAKTGKDDVMADQKTLTQVQHVLLVGAGKGGVGKSTVAFNLALALAAAGARVGLLDGDLYGPSLPILAGIQGERLVMTEEGKILPVQKHGLKMISLGLLLKETDAIVWRGPLLHKTIQQFIGDVEWGELDYLLIDLPPGTGDIQLSLHQLVKVSAALVVTTPQALAFADVLRAVKMFEKLEIPVVGLVENMSFFEAPDTGTRYWPFGKGRIQASCDQHGVTHLGQIPMLPAVPEASDAGVPLADDEVGGGARRYYKSVAGAVASALSIAAFST